MAKKYMDHNDVIVIHIFDTRLIPVDMERVITIDYIDMMCRCNWELTRYLCGQMMILIRTKIDFYLSCCLQGFFCRFIWNEMKQILFFNKKNDENNIFFIFIKVSHSNILEHFVKNKLMKMKKR